MKILITGSKGFLGGCLGRFAARAGHQVLGVARASQPAPDWPGKYVQADMVHADVAGIIREFEPDVMFHGAGTASVGASMTAPLDDLRAAVLTWANLLEGARRAGCDPLVVFPSSAAVYGNPEKLPVSEDSPVAPISPYGFHKAACELLAREYATCFGLQLLITRVFSVYGPAQRRLLVWELFEQCLSADPVVSLQGTGEESRDFLYADDVASAVLHLAERCRRERRAQSFNVINLASGQETRAASLADQIRKLVAPAKQITCQGRQRRGDPLQWRADIARLGELAPGWRPRPLGEGLARCATAWQESAQRHAERSSDACTPR
jgi:UDP-glucose 4-epimerase